MSETLSIEKVIEIGTQVGIRTAMETIEKIKNEKCQSRYDRRLRNTQLLLKNYRNFHVHCKDAVYKKHSANAVDILDELDGYEWDSNLFVESIKKSTERTSIILDHIDRMLEIFRYITEKSGKLEEIAKYKVISAMYIDDEEKTVEEISEEMHVAVKSVYRYKNIGIEYLSSLIFGIDSLKSR